MILTRLVYCSTASPKIGYQDLKDILEVSQKNNPPVGLTGMLCYGNSKFLQVLEGNRKYVSETYNRIIQDPRHFNTELIYFAEVDARYFSEWSMRVLDLGEYVPATLKRISMRYSSLPEFDPAYMTAQQCLGFLDDMQALAEKQNQTKPEKQAV